MIPELVRLSDAVIKTATDFQDEEIPTAKAFLQEAPDDCPAAALYTAVRTLYGINFLLWEPETLWHTLKDDGIDLSVESRDKIQAAIALQLTPAFYWDSLVFQNTVQSFNDVLYVPELLQENNPAHMSWAVYEAEIIRGMDPEGNQTPEFDEDVQVYIAICLKRAGLVLPPDNLKFSEDALALHSTPEALELKKRVRAGWNRLDKENLQEKKFSEDPLDIQLSRLAGCHLYVMDRAKILAEALIEVKGN